jgi:hypothetical protein
MSDDWQKYASGLIANLFPCPKMVKNLNKDFSRKGLSFVLVQHIFTIFLLSLFAFHLRHSAESRPRCFGLKDVSGNVESFNIHDLYFNGVNAA